MKKLPITLLLFAFINTIYGQSIFQRSYGNNRNERCQSAFPTSDGGFMLNGATTSFGNSDVDALITKTDAQGNIQWVKTCGSNANEIPYFAAETFDHKFIFAGTSGVNSVGAQTDALIFKTDSTGNFLWAKSFGGQNNETAVKIIELPNYDYAFTGTTESYGAGAGDIYFIRTDANGDTVFTGVYGTSADEKGTSFSPTSDGGFIICGKSSSTISGALVFQAILLRIDSTGNILWTKLYGDSLFQEAQSVAQTADGGFVVCGARDFTSNGNYDILLFRTESNGNLIWSKTYGGNKGEGSYTVNLNSDGSYVLSGYTNSMGYGHQLKLSSQSTFTPNYLHGPSFNDANTNRGDDSTNIFLMKTDANGDTLWTRTYGDSLQEEAFLSQKTTDGGYIISGFSDYHRADSSQMFVIKTDSLGFSGCDEFTSHPVIVSDLLAVSNGNYSQSLGMTVNALNLSSTSRNISDSVYCLSTGVNESPSDYMFSVSPNPVSDKLFVKLKYLEESTVFSFKNIRLEIYNLLGEKIIEFSNINIKENYFEINVASLNSGFYILKATSDKGRFAVRFLKV